MSAHSHTATMNYEEHAGKVVSKIIKKEVPINSRLKSI